MRLVSSSPVFGKEVMNSCAFDSKAAVSTSFFDNLLRYRYLGGVSGLGCHFCSRLAGN